MDKETLQYVEERCKTLVATGSSKQETKDAAQTWLDAVAAAGSNEAVEAATTTLLDYLDGKPKTVDGLIEFFSSDAGKQLFGEEKAAEVLEAQKKRKEEGAKFCSCEACTAASEILGKFGRVEL